MARDLIAELESEYDPDTGAIGQIRYGHVDEAALGRLPALLRECPSATDGPVDGQLVRLPLVDALDRRMASSEAREGKSAEQVQRAGEAIFKELERILGVA